MNKQNFSTSQLGLSDVDTEHGGSAHALVSSSRERGSKRARQKLGAAWSRTERATKLGAAKGFLSFAGGDADEGAGGSEAVM